MIEEVRKYLYQEIDKFELELPLIVNLFCLDDNEKLIGKMSLINMLWDEVLSKKILIKNDYGVLGNLLYKYKDLLDSEMLLYLFDKDVENLYLNDWRVPINLEEIKLKLKYVDKPFNCLRVDYESNDFVDVSNNKKFLLEVVKIDGVALEYADDKLKSDKEIVMEAVINDGYSLQYADKKFIKDKEIVMNAVKSNGYAIKFVLDEYIDDVDFLWSLLMSNENNTFCKLNGYDYYRLKERIKTIYGIEDSRYVELTVREELNYS